MNKLDQINIFPTNVYSGYLPDFLDLCIKVSNQYFEEMDNNGFKVDEIYPVAMTKDFFDNPEILSFVNYIERQSAAILDEQGFDLNNFQTNVVSLFSQKHFKFSSHNEHVHPHTFMSGVYILEFAGKDLDSRIIFHDPRPAKRQMSFNEKDPQQLTAASVECNFPLYPGLFFISNSWLPHSFSRHGSSTPLQFLHFSVSLVPRQDNSFKTVVV